jgi:hypothetical protein
MIHSVHRNGKAKAIAEVLAMIADAHPEFAPHRPRLVPETDERLEESATEFCAALDLFVIAKPRSKKTTRLAKTR